LKNRVGMIHRRLTAQKAPRPGVLVLEWTEPAFSAGHWVPDMVRRAGGHEPLGRSGEASQRIGRAEILSSKPEVVVVAPCGYGLEETVRETTTLAGTEAWSWMRTIPVWAIDANRLTSSPGPGVVHGIEVLARILHPALFGNPSPRDAIQVSP
jgi:iron complex transport system substrate-binding protein